MWILKVGTYTTLLINISVGGIYRWGTRCQGPELSTATTARHSAQTGWQNSTAHLYPVPASREMKRSKNRCASKSTATLAFGTRVSLNTAEVSEAFAGGAEHRSGARR